MELTLLAVGKLRPEFRTACDDYLRRLGRYVTVRAVEIREAGRIAGPAERLRVEGEGLRKRVPAGALVVALDREGNRWSSEELAARLGGWRLTARPIALLVGGSHGLHPPLLQAAKVRWSLGPLTLPHELARVVAVEQLYRACTIGRGERYHK